MWNGQRETSPGGVVDSSTQGRIASAWAALHGARQATWHSPSGDNCAVEAMCEATVNGLLEVLWSEMTEEQRAEVEARPMWTLVAG
jgi:hypothetical protein